MGQKLVHGAGGDVVAETYQPPHQIAVGDPYLIRTGDGSPANGAPRFTERVTTRQVPIPCAVCQGRGCVKDPSDFDNEDAEWIRCKPCDGKGWLMVTETITERSA